jgi:lysophospholipase L1-like esterase
MFIFIDSDATRGLAMLKCHPMKTAVDEVIQMNRLTLFAILALAVAFLTGCSATHVGAGAELYQATKHAAPAVVFMGDSITNLWDVPGFGYQYFTQYPTWIGAGEINDDSGQMVARFQSQVVDALCGKSSVCTHPAVVAILAGTNDVYPGWQLCGGNPVYDTCDNIKTMVQQAKAAGIQPILATIPPWGCDDPRCSQTAVLDDSQARYTRIDALNAWIKSYGEQQRLIVVDYHSALMAADGQTYRPELTLDGVNPSDAGYALMTPMIEDAITASQYK